MHRDPRKDRRRPRSGQCSKPSTSVGCQNLKPVVTLMQPPFESTYDVPRRSRSSMAGSLNLGTADIWGWKFFALGASNVPIGCQKVSPVQT